MKDWLDAKKITPDKITACVLKRPRHDQIVNSLNSLGVKIKFITDGDVTWELFQLQIQNQI